MEIINSDVLEQLKCSFCDKYLSYGPVQLVENGNNVCGRCSVPEGMKASRMMPYEHVVKDHKFPCQHKGNGCVVKVKFSEMKSHEFLCYFRPFNCPILKECEWSGVANHFVVHCKQKHPKNVLANPATLEHDMTKSNSRTFVMVAFDLFFLIYVKICWESRNIYHSVQQILGSVNEPNTFDLIISNANGNGELRRKGNVALAENVIVLENHAVIENINSLTILGPVKDTKFQINIIKSTIIETFQQRIQPFIDPNFLNTNFCQLRAFFIDKKTCKYVGCIYHDTYYDLLKHEIFYCQFCYICLSDQVIAPNIMSTHLLTKHSSRFTHIFNKTLKFESIIFVSPILNDYVHLYYKMTDIDFKLKVYTPIAKTNLTHYKFQVIFLGTMNETYELELLPITNKLEDWTTTVDIKKANVIEISFTLDLRK